MVLICSLSKTLSEATLEGLWQASEVSRDDPHCSIVVMVSSEMHSPQRLHLRIASCCCYAFADTIT